MYIKGPDGETYEEKYEAYFPQLIIGNLIMGQRYIEPTKQAKIVNLTTGEYAEAEYKPRGTFSTRPEDLQFMSGFVKSKDGKPLYSFQGKYTEKMTVTDLKTRESFVTYERKYLPKTIQDPKKIYGYNLIALQLNSKSDELIAKLPPTDSRLRPDLNNWESANLEAA